MKRIGLFILLSLTILGCVVNAYAGNYIQNPSFDSLLAGWTDQGSLPAAISTSIYKSAPYAATRDVDSSTINERDYWAELNQEIDLAEGEAVFGGMYVKTTFSPLATARAGLIIQFLDSSSGVLDSISTPQVGGNTNWRAIMVSNQTAPVGTVKVRVICYLWAKKDDTASLTGSVYFDNVYMDKTYRTIPLQLNLLNGRFENGLNDWTDVYGNPATVSSTVVHGGSYAAQKTINDVTSRDYWSQLYQIIKCPAGKKVVVNAYIKNDFDAAAKAKTGVQLEFYTTDDILLKTAKTQIGPSATWQPVTVTVNPTPAGTAKVRLSLYTYAPRGDTISLDKSAYFDDVTYQRLAPSGAVE